MDTLDTNPYNIHMMRPSPAYTRTRTLQGRLGTHQEVQCGAKGRRLGGEVGLLLRLNRWRRGLLLQQQF